MNYSIFVTFPTLGRRSVLSQTGVFMSIERATAILERHRGACVKLAAELAERLERPGTDVLDAFGDDGDGKGWVLACGIISAFWLDSRRHEITIYGSAIAGQP